VFATLGSSPERWVKILVGFFSIAAAVLSSLQTFLRLGELAEKHSTASLKYGALHREVEEMQSKAAIPPDYPITVRTRWVAIDSESPTVSPKLFDKVQTSIRGSPPIPPS
jgi:hypothetical protein